MVGLTHFTNERECGLSALAPVGSRGYSGAMTVRPIHDVAFAIASALTEKMEYKLVDAEREGFHRLCYETAKTALTSYGPSQKICNICY